MLFQLHVGNAVHQKASHTVIPFVYGNLMAPFVELVSRRKACRAGAHNGHFLACAHLRRFCSGKSLLVCIFSDSIFIFLHRHGVTVMTAGTGRFTESRTYSGRKFRKIIGFHQTVISLLPVTRIDQIIPFRYQIVQRAAGRHSHQLHAGLTEGYAAGHTPGALPLLFFSGQRRVKLQKVPGTLFG